MPESLPLFPLQVVLFPGVLLPLHIFEERYRTLMARLLELPEDGGRRFGVVAIRQGWEVGPDAARALHPVGCAAELRRVEDKDDGSYDVVTVGVQRFRLHSVDTEAEPYLVGEVEWLESTAETGPEVDLLAQRAGVLFEEYVAAVAATGGADVAAFELPTEPDVLSYLIASAAMLTLDDRQSLLELGSTRDRLREEIRIMRREIVLVRELRVVPTTLDELRTPPGDN